MGLRGKDGAEYNDVDELMKANARWEQQETQNRLLKEANELNERIARENANIRQQEMELEYQKLDEERRNADKIARATEFAEEMRRINEQNLQFDQQQHEREMRYAKLCDEMGIAYEDISDFGWWLGNLTPEQEKYYNNIIDKYNSFVNTEEIRTLKKKIDKDAKKLTKLEEEIEEREDFDDDIEVRGLYKNGISYSGSIEEINSDIETNKTVIKSCKSLIGFVSVIAVILGMYLSNIDTDFIKWVLIIAGSIDFLLILRIISLKNGLRLLEEAAKKYSHSKNSLSSRVKKLKSTIKQNKKNLKKMQEDTMKELETNAEFQELLPLYDEALTTQPIDGYRPNQDKFREFRCNHYNKEMETLLKNLCMRIDRIPSNEIKGTGTVEDYMEYMNNILTSAEYKAIVNKVKRDFDTNDDDSNDYDDIDDYDEEDDE